MHHDIPQLPDFFDPQQPDPDQDDECPQESGDDEYVDSGVDPEDNAPPLLEIPNSAPEPDSLMDIRQTHRQHRIAQPQPQTIWERNTKAFKIRMPDFPMSNMTPQDQPAAPPEDQAPVQAIWPTPAETGIQATAPTRETGTGSPIFRYNDHGQRIDEHGNPLEPTTMHRRDYSGYVDLGHGFRTERRRARRQAHHAPDELDHVRQGLDIRHDLSKIMLRFEDLEAKTDPRSQALLAQLGAPPPEPDRPGPPLTVPQPPQQIPPQQVPQLRTANGGPPPPPPPGNGGSTQAQESPAPRGPLRPGQAYMVNGRIQRAPRGDPDDGPPGDDPDNNPNNDPNGDGNRPPADPRGPPNGPAGPSGPQPPHWGGPPGPPGGGPQGPPQGGQGFFPAEYPFGIHEPASNTTWISGDSPTYTAAPVVNGNWGQRACRNIRSPFKCRRKLLPHLQGTHLAPLGCNQVSELASYVMHAGRQLTNAYFSSTAAKNRPNLSPALYVMPPQL